MEFDLDNMYCGAIRRGDIFLHEEIKGKEIPVVVLQDNILNDGLPSVVCALLVPHKKGQEVFANEVCLKSDETGLGKDALCQLHKIVTMDRRGMVAKKGELSVPRLQEVYHALDVNCGRFRDQKTSL